MEANPPAMIVLDPADNVATALRDLDGPASVSVANAGGTRFDLPITGPIRLGHKAAIRTIPASADVVKHGHPIGRTTAQIEAGEHVHVHNVVSLSRLGERQEDTQ